MKKLLVPANAKYIPWLLAGVAVLFIAAIGSSYYLLVHTYPGRWSQRLDLIEFISENPLKYEVKLPSPAIYRYKYLKLTAANTAIKSPSNIKISITNRSTNKISVESEGYFADTLNPHDMAIVFKGTLYDLNRFNEQNQPILIINVEHDDVIEITIFSDHPIHLSSPLQLSIHAWADFL